MESGERKRVSSVFAHQSHTARCGIDRGGAGGKFAGIPAQRRLQRLAQRLAHPPAQVGGQGLYLACRISNLI